MRKGSRHSSRDLVGSAQGLVCDVVNPADSNVSLIRQTNQMPKNAHALSVALHLSEHNILSAERRSDCPEIALITRRTENRRVADDLEAPRPKGGQLLDDAVGQIVAEPRERWITGFIVESGHGNDHAGRPAPRRVVDRSANHENCRKDGPSSHRLSQPVLLTRRRRVGLRGRGRLWELDRFDWTNEFVPFLGARANVARRTSVVAEGAPDLRDAEIQPALKVDECIVAPDDAS